LRALSSSPARPTGVTWVALALLCFCVSAMGNLIAWTTLQTTSSFPPGSPGDRFVGALAQPMLPPLLGLYGVTALLAAIGAWRMRPWMARAFLLWAATAFGLLTFLLLVVPTELVWGGEFAGIAFVLGSAAILWIVYRYLRRVGSRQASTEP
jgi:hypothetical protein